MQALQIVQPHTVKATTWWRNLKQRHAEHPIQYAHPDLAPDLAVDADLLDNVTDNLLQNALEKARVESDLDIRVTLRGGDGLLLEVSDNGSAIPEIIATQLFKGHVPSENGLGIGLYHAGRQARQAGYLLKLSSNYNGRVCFTLSKL